MMKNIKYDDLRITSILKCLLLKMENKPKSPQFRVRLQINEKHLGRGITRCDISPTSATCDIASQVEKTDNCVYNEAQSDRFSHGASNAHAYRSFRTCSSFIAKN